MNSFNDIDEDEDETYFRSDAVRPASNRMCNRAVACAIQMRRERKREERERREKRGNKNGTIRRGTLSREEKGREKQRDSKKAN